MFYYILFVYFTVMAVSGIWPHVRILFMAFKRILIKNNKLYKKLDNYVKLVTKDRPPSHGYSHMKAVAERSIEWFDYLPLNILLQNCQF